MSKEEITTPDPCGDARMERAIARLERLRSEEDEIGVSLQIDAISELRKEMIQRRSVGKVSRQRDEIMNNESNSIVTVYRIHARCGKFPCESCWFLTRDEAVNYPDDDWKDINIEERRAIIIDGDLFVMSDTGLFNPEHE